MTRLEGAGRGPGLRLTVRWDDRGTYRGTRARGGECLINNCPLGLGGVRGNSSRSAAEESFLTSGQWCELQGPPPVFSRSVMVKGASQGLPGNWGQPRPTWRVLPPCFGHPSSGQALG